MGRAPLRLAAGSCERCSAILSCLPRSAGTPPLLAFGLDATGGDCAVIDAFLPDEPVSSRDSAGREVTFYPFLVVTDGKDSLGEPHGKIRK